jgi:hypothetical protein
MGFLFLEVFLERDFFAAADLPGFRFASGSADGGGAVRFCSAVAGDMSSAAADVQCGGGSGAKFGL